MGCKCQKPEQENPNQIESHLTKQITKTKNQNQNHSTSSQSHYNNINISQNERQLYGSVPPPPQIYEEPTNTKASTVPPKEITNVNEMIVTQIPQSNKKTISPRETVGYPTDPFCQYIYEHINRIRVRPESFVDEIIKGKERITERKAMKNGQEETQLVYKSKVKVALNRGAPAFDEAVDFLQNQKPLQPLQFMESLCVPVPDNEIDLKDKEYIKRRVEEMLEKEIKINSYWRDIVRDAETSFLLMIVDDTGKKAFKRGDIFNEDFKYVGISSLLIDKTFSAYLTFSK